MEFPRSFFEDEVRDGFYIPALMKRAWAAEMQVLEDVDKVCKKHNIKYFVDWGTLLGAVRHGGFIPWDDDIDISMLRADYEKFIQVASDELQEWYEVNTFKNLEESKFKGEDFMTYVHSGNIIRNDKKYCDYFHGYPLVVGVDVFPLDYMAPTEKEDELQLEEIRLLPMIADNYERYSEKEREEYLNQVEEIYNIKFHSEKSIVIQLYLLADEISRRYSEKDSTYIIPVAFRAFGNKRYIFEKQNFSDVVRLPFENICVPVPVMYDAVLKAEFLNYQEKVRECDSHAYPVYESQLADFKEKMGKNLFPEYSFQKDEPVREKNKNEHSLKQLVVDMLALLKRVHIMVGKAIQQGDLTGAAELLEQCQNGAITIGEKIEKVKKEEYITVKLLEQYCEAVYITHEIILGYMEGSIIDALKEIQNSLLIVEESARKDILGRREVVFLPFRDSAWDSLDNLWKELKEKPDCDVHVLPIPYYYRAFDGKEEEMVFLKENYPHYLEIEDYRDFDFELFHPDIIVIQNPYDSYNITTGVHPFFYSSSLIQYTDCLIYTPYFQVEDFDKEDGKAVFNMKYYCLMPGVVNADIVIVQSEKMRQRYIEKLTEFAGEETRNTWEKKIQLDLSMVLSAQETER